MVKLVSWPLLSFNPSRSAKSLTHVSRESLCDIGGRGERRYIQFKSKMTTQRDTKKCQTYDVLALPTQAVLRVHLEL